MCCDKIIAARIQRNLCELRISAVFDFVRTSRSSDKLYPTQATKQVRLLFRSHCILTCNSYFKGGKFENFDTF